MTRINILFEILEISTAFYLLHGYTITKGLTFGLSLHKI